MSLSMYLLTAVKRNAKGWSMGGLYKLTTCTSNIKTCRLGFILHKARIYTTKKRGF